MAKKIQCDVGLTQPEVDTVQLIAGTEEKPQAEVLGELVRLGLTVKVAAMTAQLQWKELMKA